MQVNIRIRDDLYKKLREEAQKEHRTITAQLEIILLEALAAQETKTIDTSGELHTQDIDIHNKNNSNYREEYEAWI